MIDTALPYSVPREPGRWQAVTLAILVHALLLAFLWFGINWVNDKPETIEAEVWSPQELAKAPPPVATPQPEPEPVTVKQPPKEEATPPAVDPDIALEQKKEKKRLEKEKKAQEEAAELAKKEKAAKLAEEKAEEKKREDAAKKLEDDKQKKLVEEKRKHQDALDAKKLAQDREAEIKRITGDTDSAPSSNNGTAKRSQGAQGNATWIGRIKVIIKSHMNFPVSGDSNDPVEYDVKILPDGAIASITKIKSSGISGFDEAVRRAIELSEPFPTDSAGKYPINPLPITYRPRD